MTSSKNIHFLKKINNQFWKKKFQTSFRSGKLFCKFQEFFKSSRSYTNPGWLCDVNLFHSLLKILPQEWLKVGYLLFTIYVGKPESHLLFEKSVPVTKNGCKGMKLVTKMARRQLEHKFPFETFRLEKQDLPFQMF